MNTINNPIYYIDIEDETTNLTKRVNILDTSLYANRYNQFKLEVTATYSYESLTASIVYLNEGKHNYNVLTFDGTASYQLCETGILQVNKLHTTTYSTYSDSIPLSITYSSYSDRM